MLSAKQILDHLQTLREEIKTLSALDSERRSNRLSSDQAQHEARLARIEAIRHEIAGLMRKK
jgi:hypothetical protein